MKATHDGTDDLGCFHSRYQMSWSNEIA